MNKKFAAFQRENLIYFEFGFMFFVDFLLHKLFVYKYLPCFVQRSFNDFKQLELFVVAATASATVAVVVSVSGWCFLNIFPCLPWLIVMQFVCIVHDKQTNPCNDTRSSQSVPSSSSSSSSDSGGNRWAAECSVEDAATAAATSKRQQQQQQQWQQWQQQQQLSWNYVE